MACSFHIITCRGQLFFSHGFPPLSPDPVTKAIDKERRKMFSSDTFFEADYYMTLCWLPPAENKGMLKDIIIEGREKKEIQAEDFPAAVPESSPDGPALLECVFFCS